MLSDAEREVLNSALEKYRPGQSQPILVGGENMLKPALRLMNLYRLRIEEIKDAAVVTSYTRWLELRSSEGREKPRSFERILLESKKRLPEYVSKKPADLELRSQFRRTIKAASSGRIGFYDQDSANSEKGQRD